MGRTTAHLKTDTVERQLAQMKLLKEKFEKENESKGLEFYRGVYLSVYKLHCNKIQYVL